MTLLVGLGWLFAAQPAYAAQHVWAGGYEDGDWDATPNWAAGGIPANNETVDLVFPASAAGRVSTNNRGGIIINSITFLDGGFTLEGRLNDLPNGTTRDGRTVTLSGPITSCNDAANPCVSAAPNTISLAMTLSAVPQVTVGTAGASPLLSFSGLLSGAGGITKSGAGALQLGGNNSFTGSTTVSGGTLTVASAGALGTAAGNTSVSSGATLAVNNGVTVAAEPLTLSGGTLTVPQSARATWGGPISLAANSTASAASGGTLTIAGTVDGAPVLATAGAGTVKSAGTVGGSVPPKIDVQAGTLDISGTYMASETDIETGGAVLASIGADLSSPLHLAGGTLQSNGAGHWSGAVTLTADSTIALPASAFVLTDPVAGAFTLTKTGGAALTASGGVGQSTPLAALSVSGGVMSINSGLSTSLGTTVSNGSLLILSGLSQTPLAVDNGTVNIQNSTLRVDTALALTGATITGTGNLSLNGDATVNASPTTSTISTGLMLTATNPTFTVADGAAEPDLLVDGVLTDGVGVNGQVKAGPGTMKLSANNTYQGSTSISAGTLQVTGQETGSAIALSGGFLTGTGSVGPIAATGGSVRPGDPADPTGVLSTAGNVALSGATVGIDLAGTTPGVDYDEVNVTGTVNLTGAALSVSLGTGFTPSIGTSFIIIANDGLDAIVGTFNGLPEGAGFIVNGVPLGITYAGGSGGNDVVLAVVPTVSISDASVTEGSSGTNTLAFTVSLSAPAASGLPVSVQYATADGSATAPADYATTTGTIVFGPSETARQIVVPIASDVAIEGDETFGVNLTGATNVVIAKGSATGTILNDDVATATPTPTPTATATMTPTASVTLPPTASVTMTPTPTFTPTPTLTSTPTGPSGPGAGPGGSGGSGGPGGPGAGPSGPGAGPAQSAATPTITPTLIPTATPTPPPVTVSVSRAGNNRLLVTVTALGTLQRVAWAPAPNIAVEDGVGAPIPGGQIVLPPGSNRTAFYVRRLSGTSATLPLTLTGSFGTWQTFVGGGADAW